MAEYLHGAYGQIQANGTRASTKTRSAIVYIGTAPVHTVAGGAANVNRPILISDMAEAAKRLGYSDDWEKYTLCEAMHAHLELKGVGPLVMINVLDPAVHKGETSTVNLTPENGRISIVEAGDIILDSVSVKGKTRGRDYSVQYDYRRRRLTISEMTRGALGSEAIEITYDSIDATAVEEDDVIGASDGQGLNTGLFAIKNVYQETGYIPSFLLAPGFSGMPAVHSEMIANSQKVNGHWDVYVMADLPIQDGDGESITLSNAAAWKSENGYSNGNETVYFPMVNGTDGRLYHLSVLAAANFQELLANQDGIPYRSASNTACSIIKNLYMGEDSAGRVFDDYIINTQLNRNGIASAAYVGGRWAIWGCHSADYTQDEGDMINVAETNRMMLYYISNDFQHRRTQNVDKPMTANDLKTIVSEEQTRLDALVKLGALTYGTVYMNAGYDARSDIMNGDYSFTFNVTTTPLAKSLTAIVNWTDDGFMTYFAE